MLELRPHDYGVQGADVGFAAEPDPLAASPADLVLVPLVFGELVTAYVHDKVATVRVPELNWKKEKWLI